MLGRGEILTLGIMIENLDDWEDYAKALRRRNDQKVTETEQESKHVQEWMWDSWRP